MVCFFTALYLKQCGSSLQKAYAEDPSTHLLPFPISTKTSKIFPFANGNQLKLEIGHVKISGLHKLIEFKCSHHPLSSGQLQHNHVCGFRNGIAILDSDKTLICLRNAFHFIGSPICKKGRTFFLKTNHIFIYEIMEEQ